MIWLQESLEHAKLSIKKLQKLFGIIPRIRKKHRKNKGDEENKSSTDDKEKEDEGGTGTASNHQSSRRIEATPKKKYL